MTTDSPFVWVKSSYSSNGGSCVEWAPSIAATGMIPVRDSKDTAGPNLVFSTEAWAGFIGTVRQDDFDA